MNQDFPCFKTQRLQLRQTTYEDTNAVFAIFTDPKVTRFHNLNTFKHLDEARKVIEQRRQGFIGGKGIRWGIVHREYSRLIGSCGFTWDDAGEEAEVGYELISEFWQQGIMSEALTTILQYGFECKRFQSVIAQIMLENAASKKLLEKLGFQTQGIIKRQGYWKGKYYDLEEFVLRKCEY